MYNKQSTTILSDKEIFNVSYILQPHTLKEAIRQAY